MCRWLENVKLQLLSLLSPHLQEKVPCVTMKYELKSSCFYYSVQLSRQYHCKQGTRNMFNNLPVGR